MLAAVLVSAAMTSPSTAKPSPPPPAVVPAAPVLPVERPYPTVLDAPVEYEGMTLCEPVARPGALMLRQLLLDTYGRTDIGITRACDQDTVSEHKEGRAVDWMVDWHNPAEFAQAQAFVDWATAPGPDGTPAANARRLGIMYIIWADKMWRAYDPGRGWTELKGCHSLQSPSYDTFCHRNHVHFSLTWDGAAARTSYWDGTPVTRPVCPVGSPSGTPKRLRADHQFVPVRPVRVFDGRTRGAAGCVVAQRRWSGDNRSVPVKVVGRGGVPTSGVSAVAARITAYDSNAPGLIGAAALPGFGATAVSLGMGATSAGTTIVPVSTTGRIWIATAAGHATVAVDVLGYFTGSRGSAAASGPDARKAGDGRSPAGVSGGSGSGSPSAAGTPATTAGAVVGQRLGGWHVAVGAPVSAELQPGELRALQVGGPAPAGATGAVVTANVRGSGGRLRVFPAGTTSRADAITVHTDGTTASGTLFAATPAGAVVVANRSKSATTVTLVPQAWVTAPVVDGLRLVPLSRTVGAGLRLRSRRALDVGLTVPKATAAALLAVTTRGARADGGITVWGTGPRPTHTSVEVHARRATTELVMAPVADDHILHLAGAPRGATASVRLVAVLR